MVKNCIFCINKCYLENDMLELGVREKNFGAPPDASNGFGRVLWDLGYPQNQTGWLYDASIDFYATKRKQVAIFAFSKHLKAIFKEFFFEKM